MGKIQVLGVEGLRGRGSGGVEQTKRGRGGGLRIICKPKVEADCGNSVGEGVEAFVSNGPTVRVGPEVEAKLAGQALLGSVKNQKSQDPLEAGTGTKRVKDKHQADRQKGQWLLTNGNDVHLVSKSIEIYSTPFLPPLYSAHSFGKTSL